MVTYIVEPSSDPISVSPSIGLCSYREYNAWNRITRPCYLSKWDSEDPCAICVGGMAYIPYAWVASTVNGGSADSYPYTANNSRYGSKVTYSLLSDASDTKDEVLDSFGVSQYRYYGIFNSPNNYGSALPQIQCLGYADYSGGYIRFGDYSHLFYDPGLEQYLSDAPPDGGPAVDMGGITEAFTFIGESLADLDERLGDSERKVDALEAASQATPNLMPY